MKRVYIIIVNYNGWADTIECLESVFRNYYPNYRVVVVDNNSANNSLEYIRAWAEGRLDVAVAPDNPLRHLSSPPVAKPVSYVGYSKAQAEAGGVAEEKEASLVLIQNKNNNGFAAGNNIGLRYVLKRNDYSYVWLLNGDTVVERNALSALLARMEEKPAAGMCGSIIYYYREPKRVQRVCGATYNKWLGVARPIGFGQSGDVAVRSASVEEAMDFIDGASLLASRSFLEHAGLMCEDYFLFFEELDWAVRCRERYSLACAVQSVVFHKVGGSRTMAEGQAGSNTSTDYYMIRNRLLFTHNFFPFARVTVFTGLLVSLFNRIRRGQWSRAWIIFRLMVSKNYSPAVIEN